MLPSTGYFKTINCPFYNSGSCDRPYCHFKHARREDGASSTEVAEVVEAQTASQTQENKATTVVASNSDMLQQLVTEAVKKVLADKEVTVAEKFPENIVSQVVEELKPTLASSSTASMRNTAQNVVGKHIAIPTPIMRPVTCVYNPTPIAELKKRHIPVVSYMPTRESRVAVKRKCSPERAKPWLSIVQESSSSQQPEITYKPTAIVNTTDQDAVPDYVPTFKSDSSTSNSYDDGNSNDYQSKFKKAYYPKSKKRREEYVPKMVKAPLKTVQQLNDVTMDQFEPEFDIIDEIFTSSHTVSNTLEQAKVVSSEDSQDYSLDIEPKFSDEEPSEDISKEECSTSVKKAEQTSDVNEKVDKDLQHAKVDKQTSNKDNKIHNNHYDAKTGDIKTSDKFKQYKENDANKSSDKKKEDAKEDVDKEKETHKSHSKSKKKDRKDHHSSDKRDKSKSGHKSDSKSRHHSSSSKDKDKDKRRSSRDSKESSHKDEERSRRDRRSSPKKDRNDHHKSSRHDKHRSKTSSSSSKSSKHTSSKSDKKHHSESSRRSSISRKSSEHKESSSERNLSDGSDDSYLINIHPFADESIIEISDSDHDVQEECLKIFQEYEVSDHPKVVSVKESSKRESEESVEEIGRKRIAHPLAATSVTKHVGPSHPPKKLISPQQKMYERWRLMREAMAEKAAEKAAAETKTQITSTSAPQLSNKVHKEHTEPISSSISNNYSQLNGNGRVRIAHVPYAQSLAMEKKKVAMISAKNKDEEKQVESKTTAQTTKGGVRIAHVPQSMPKLVRPEPLQVTNRKFPLTLRQYYINIMHDICVQIYTSSDDAAERAAKEEFACHERCKALVVYKNACTLATHRLRKEVDQSKSDTKFTGSSCGMVSHEAMLAGKSKGSWSVVKTKKNVVDFKGSALYAMLKKWIMTEDQLRGNGFPRSHPDGPKGRAKVYVINSRNQSVLSKVPNERMCSRCGQAYMVNKHSFAVQQQNCIYHWGRKFTIRGEGKYSCCQQYGSATGCCDAKTHVWDYTDYENLRGYIETLSKDISVEEQERVYALDCEMCYTTNGLELTRVTVINDDCNVIYETLVKPQNPIIDYNTRFSGITEEDMKDVTTTLLDVQATLLTMFCDKTILVGHSLESDFKALRLLHNTVVDTSVMFPHKNGLPQKRALKNLCSDYLRKIIQNDVGGHDSKEDAVACMELILWKVKEEAKLQ